MSESKKALFQEKRVKNLHKDGITSIELLNDSSIFSCDDDTILLYNLNTDTKQVLYSGKKSKVPDELGCMKAFSLNSADKNYLYTANNEYLQLFDLVTFKQINKYKFSKETVNSIEMNKSGNMAVCSDDLGEVKVLDIRIKPAKGKQTAASTLPTITLKKSLASHSNICSMALFNGTNENEIFSSSFDCSILKWDLRMVKSGDKPFVNKIDMNETMVEINNAKKTENMLVSTMTPSFVHNIHVSEVDGKSLLLSGLENGLCILYDTSTCKYYDHEQMQPFNCALTQLTSFELSDLMRGLVNSPEYIEILAGSGNGKTIEFFGLGRDPKKDYVIRKFNSLQIDHVNKVNSLRYLNKKLFVADTSNDLTILNFDK